MAQTLEGHYDAAKKDFIPKEIPFMKPEFTTLPPCIDGLCRIRNQQGLEGLIDTTGKIILFPKKFGRLYFHPTLQGIYVLGKSPSSECIMNDKAEVLLQSAHGILPLYSDTLEDLFFVATEQLSFRKPAELRGEIWKIAHGKRELAIEARTYYAHSNDPSYRAPLNKEETLEGKSRANGYTPSHNIFISGLLVSPAENNTFKVMNMHLDPLYSNAIIGGYMVTDTFHPIIKTDDYTFCYYYSSNKEVAPLCFRKYEYINSAAMGLAYKTSTKWGGLVYSNTTLLKPISIPAIFDSIWQSNNMLAISKNDTVWYYNSQCFNDTFNYNRIFKLCYKLKRNGQEDYLGGDNTYIKNPKLYRASNSPLIPTHVFGGFNFHRYSHLKPNSIDTASFGAMNVELGVGYYTFDEDDEDLFSESFYGGVGVSFEKRIPFISQEKIYNRTGENLKPVFLNIRAEGGYKAECLYIIPFSIQGQLTYSTDFTYHYLRPGIGLYLGRLQIGLEGIAPLNHRSSKIISIEGVYLRYFFGGE
jgi:hypothetical protein